MFKVAGLNPQTNRRLGSEYQYNGPLGKATKVLIHYEEGAQTQVYHKDT